MNMLWTLAPLIDILLHLESSQTLQNYQGFVSNKTCKQHLDTYLFIYFYLRSFYNEPIQPVMSFIAKDTCI